MSVAQNLAYAVVQVIHNLGAVATVGGALAATRLRDADKRMKLARLALGGWGVQIASGAAFGAVSYYFYHQFPDISGIALVALEIKMACATFGFLLLTLYLFRSKNWTTTRVNGAWIASCLLAVTALSAAAFLRWFA